LECCASMLEHHDEESQREQDRDLQAMTLTLRPTKLEGSPAIPHRKDWTVYEDGQPIGRIYEVGSAVTAPELRWFWSILAVVRVTGVTRYGHAATLEEATAKFRDNWKKAQRG